MTFKILYDLATEKVDLFSEILTRAYFFLIVGIVLLVNYKKNKNPKSLLIGMAFTAISVLFIFIFLGGQYFGIQRAKQMMQNGNFFVVEGIPENYHPMPKEGHDTERFDIGGVHFEYSDFIHSAPGYNNAASLGGVIFANNYYRLTYYKLKRYQLKNRILRIEIRE
jgi:hypothetical protein